MTGRVLLISPRATADLKDIWSHIADDDEDRADEVIDFLFEHCSNLLAMPSMGRARDELRPGVRSWPAKSWVVFYRVTPDNVEIIRVLHGRQDVPCFS